MQKQKVQHESKYEAYSLCPMLRGDAKDKHIVLVAGTVWVMYTMYESMSSIIVQCSISISIVVPV